MTWGTPGSWLQLYTTGLNSLAVGARVTATANNPTSNTIEYVQFDLWIRFGSAPTVDRQVLIYILPESATGNTFSDGGSGVAPSYLNLAATCPVRAVTTDQRWVTPPLILPPGNSQILVVNDTDQAFASALSGAGNLALAYRLTGRS